MWSKGCPRVVELQEPVGILEQQRNSVLPWVPGRSWHASASGPRKPGLAGLRPLAVSASASHLTPPQNSPRVRPM